MSLDAPIGPGLKNIPLSLEPVARKEFVSDQEVRWCPGCGDYAILAAFQGLMPELGIKRENAVVVSGIGCSSRFPYYMNTYGLHTIHGRALPIATGIATSREDLAVFVVTGDGDSMSIGGNHLIHALRRNVNITVIMFNNRIYGLTKGQYSPTSEQGKITKSSPAGSLDQPFNPISLALGAEATFVARSVDSQRAHLAETIKTAVAHRGASFVEVYQNCLIFNDGAFEQVKGPEASTIPLEHGQPIVFGPDNSMGVIRTNYGLTTAPIAEVGLDSVVVHDSHCDDPAYAFSLSRLTSEGIIDQAPIGVFRDVERPTYDDGARAQIAQAEAGIADKREALHKLLLGKDTWEVS